MLLYKGYIYNTSIFLSNNPDCISAYQKSLWHKARWHVIRVPVTLSCLCCCHACMHIYLYPNIVYRTYEHLSHKQIMSCEPSNFIMQSNLMSAPGAIQDLYDTPNLIFLPFSVVYSPCSTLNAEPSYRSYVVPANSVQYYDVPYHMAWPTITQDWRATNVESSRMHTLLVPSVCCVVHRHWRPVSICQQKGNGFLVMGMISVHK